MLFLSARQCETGAEARAGQHKSQAEDPATSFTVTSGRRVLSC